MPTTTARNRLADTEQLRAQCPVAVLGAGFVDTVVTIPELPERGSDQAAQTHRVVVGGCGLNVARALVRLGVSPIIPGIPIGQGPWADIVRRELTSLGLSSPLEVDSGDNGWCFAMVEPDGERTFVTIRGVEQHLSPDLLRRMDVPPGSVLYASGYEILGDHSSIVLDWVNQIRPAHVLLDPGPKASSVTPAVLSRLATTSTMITVNQREAQLMCGANQLGHLAEFANTWRISVIYRVGARGAWLCAPGCPPQSIPTRPVSVADTIGAGDAHAAGLLGALAAGWPLPDAVWLGNQTAACSVTHIGADGTPTYSELRTIASCD